jgi:hypothetical protein
MSKFNKTGSILGCLIASLVVTWFAWEILIEGRAFHCTDEGTFSLGFWMNIDTHQSAGDRIQQGWTWEKLTFARRAYQLAFLTLWFAGSALAFRRFRCNR